MFVGPEMDDIGETTQPAGTDKKPIHILEGSD